MKITEVGKYKLLKDIKTRNSASIGTLPKGKVLNINRVDEFGHKVLSPELFDWTHWDLPVKRIKGINLLSYLVRKFVTNRRKTK